MTGIEDYDSVVREFVDAMQYLCDIGVGSIAIACNTLHLLLNTLDTSVRDRVVSIVDAAVAQVSSGSSVLILSSSTSRALRLYDKALDDGGVAQIQYVSDQDQQIIDHCIRAVM